MMISKQTKCDDIVKKVPFLCRGICFQIYVSFAVSLSVMSDGLNVGWTASTIGNLVENNSTTVDVMNLEQASLIGTLPIYCSLLPVPLAIFSANKIGRKWTILWGNALVFISWLMLYFSTNLTLIYCAVIFRGLGGSEIYTIPMVYIAEIARANIRGFLCSFISILMNIGILLSYICCLYMSLKNLTLVGVALSALMCASFIWAPKTPYFLMMDDKLDAARKSLERFRGRYENINKELNEIKTTIDRDKLERGSFLELLRDFKCRKAFIIIIAVQVFQQLSGIDAVLIFLQVIFGDVQYFSSTASSIIFCSAKLISCMLALLLMDQVGRRPLLIVSSFTTGVTLLLLGGYFYVRDVLGKDVSHVAWLPLVLLLLYVSCYNIGLGSVPFVLASEMLPTRFRALGTCAVQIAYCLSMVLTAQLFAWLKDSYGFYSAFCFLAACTFVGFVLGLLFIMETKGKTLKQIQIDIK